jgi:DNA uptake protein ComE-like DNA-binding protein
MDAAAPSPQDRTDSSAVRAAAPLPHPWPPAAQVLAAVLLAGVLVLVACHVWSLQRGAARPLQLEADTRLELNRAEPAQLMQVPGIGPALAQRIDSYRREHGRIRSLEELRQIGIGPAKLEELRPWVWVDAGEPADEEDRPPLASRQTGRSGGKGKKALPDAPIDLNQASVAQLAQLPHIGRERAEAIRAARQQRPFQSVDDLRRVPGIGVKIIAEIRPFVRVN